MIIMNEKQTRKKDLKSACLPKKESVFFSQTTGEFKKLACLPQKGTNSRQNPNIARKLQVYHDLRQATKEHQYISLDILPESQGRSPDSMGKKRLKRAKRELLETLHGQSIYDIHQDRKEKRNKALTINLRQSIHIPFDVNQADKWDIAPIHGLPWYSLLEFGKYRNLYTRGRILDISPLQILKILFHQHTICRAEYKTACKVFRYNLAWKGVRAAIRMLPDAQKQPFLVSSSGSSIIPTIKALKPSIKAKMERYLQTKIKSRSNQNSMSAIKSKASARLYHKFNHQGVLYSLPVKRGIFIHPLRIQEQFLEKFKLSNALMPELSNNKPD